MLNYGRVGRTYPRPFAEKRFPKLSQVDAQTAAEFSGGNARIAIALAEAVKRRGVPLGSLSDAQLFERLLTKGAGGQITSENGRSLCTDLFLRR